MKKPILLLIIALSSATAQISPPRETPLIEKKWEATDQTGISENGHSALKINPDKWKHAETPNFILHYRRATEARKVAREIEYDLAFIAQTLGAKPEAYARKSHVYVFQDAAEWARFLGVSGAPQWSASFALGDELFLNVREQGGGSSFDSQTLAHETTHAVIARIYQDRRWPLWLNEGFAEYMGSASVAARKGQTLSRHQKQLDFADLSLEEMSALGQYPASPAGLSRLYQSGERFVRFLMAKNPPERFVPLADQLICGKTLPEAVTAIYGDKYPDFAAFKKAYEAFGGQK